MYACTHENIDQRPQYLPGNARLGRKFLCILRIPRPYAHKKFASVLAVLGRGVDLIHESILLPVFFRRPIGCFPKEPPDVGGTPGRIAHEIILHFGHTMRRGFDDDLILSAKTVKILPGLMPHVAESFCVDVPFKPCLQKQSKQFLSNFSLSLTVSSSYAYLYKRLVYIIIVSVGIRFFNRQGKIPKKYNDSSLFIDFYPLFFRHLPLSRYRKNCPRFAGKNFSYEVRTIPPIGPEEKNARNAFFKFTSNATAQISLKRDKIHSSTIDLPEKTKKQKRIDRTRPSGMPARNNKKPSLVAKQRACFLDTN